MSSFKDHPRWIAFHQYFEQQYGEQWEALFSALQGAEHAYACLLNAFAVAQDVLEALDISKDMELNGHQWIGHLTPALKCFGNRALVPGINQRHDCFPRPYQDRNHIYTHYLLDPSSLFPVEALGVKPGHRVLDLCAAPGGKSVAICQLLFAHAAGASNGFLSVNEPDPSRRKRLKNVIKDYVPSEIADNNVQITGLDASSKKSMTGAYERDTFDRILIDAACSAERHLIDQPSVLVDSWTLQQAAEKKPKLQKQMLMNAIPLLRPGSGRLVYATCSINRAENDHVINSILSDETLMVRIIRPESVFDSLSIGSPTQYGWIILPSSTCPWGPAYFCVIERIQ